MPRSSPPGMKTRVDSAKLSSGAVVTVMPKAASTCEDLAGVASVSFPQAGGSDAQRYGLARIVELRAQVRELMAVAPPVCEGPCSRTTTRGTAFGSTPELSVSITAC